MEPGSPGLACASVCLAHSTKHRTVPARASRQWTEVTNAKAGPGHTGHWQEGATDSVQTACSCLQVPSTFQQQRAKPLTILKCSSGFISGCLLFIYLGHRKTRQFLISLCLLFQNIFSSSFSLYKPTVSSQPSPHCLSSLRPSRTWARRQQQLGLRLELCPGSVPDPCGI